MNIQNTLWDNDLKFNICKELINKSEFINEYNKIYKLWVLIDLLFISNEDIRNNILNSIELTLNEIYSDVWIVNRLLQSAFLFSSLSTNWLESENTIEEIDNIKNKSYRIAISFYYYSKLYNLKDKYNLNIKNLFSNNDIIYKLFTNLWILSEIRNNWIEDIDIYDFDLKEKILFSIKETNNSFSISRHLNLEIEDIIYYLSDFQKDVLENTLFTWKSLILSAPTSAWKTFIIKIFIITRLLEAYIQWKNINIWFILPTKALVNEIRLDFIKLIKKYWLEKDVNIHIHLSWKEFIEKQYFNKSNLFIFTQERLNYFYSDLKYNFNYNIHFNFIAVDEAHKISYGYRWTLLSYIINEIIYDNKLTQICFMTPLLKKLSKIKDNFKLQSIDFKFSNFWLVSKNLIYIKNEWRTNWNFYLKINNEELLLFSFKYKSLTQPNYLALFSKLFTNNGVSSLIYRRYPNETVVQANKINEIIIEKEKNSLEYLKEYIKDTISDNYELIDLLEKWIWFHNWRLPISIKKEIEYIYKEKNLIKFLCVNSTVLEWVNLPAKNIFIWEWAKDTKRFILSKIDLKNLIWRAWRLNNHMNWNIFFIDYVEYENKISWEDNNLEEFDSNIEKLISDESKFKRFLEYLSSDNYKKSINYDEKEERRDFEYLTWYLLSMYIKNWDIEFKTEIRKLIYNWNKDYEIESLKNKINIIYKDRLSNTKFNKNLEKILVKNIFVDPRKQIDLYENLYNEDENLFIENLNKYKKIINLIKWWWNNEEKKNILEEIIKKSQKNFIYKYKYMGIDYYENEGLIKWVINQWLSEISLKEIINSYSNKTVSDILDLINTEVLFNYLNAISIYTDIYKTVYEFKKDILINDYNLDFDDDYNIDFTPYLEIWAYQPITTYLISKWVDRESALYLKNNVFKSINLKNHKKINKFFDINKEIILKYLNANWKILIKKELEDYIY